MRNKERFFLKIGLFSIVVIAVIFSTRFNFSTQVVEALTKSQALEEIGTTNGIDTAPTEIQDMVATAYIKERIDGATREEAIDTVSNPIRYQTDSIDNTTIYKGQVGDTRYFKTADSDWQYVVNGPDNVTFTEFSKDNTILTQSGNNGYTLGQIDVDNNNIQPQTDGPDILEPKPLDPNNLPDDTNNTPAQDTIGDDANGTTNSTTAKICAEEGLKGVDFLVFHGPLVPCGINKTCENSEGKTGELAINKPCTICHFIILIKNVFDLLLSLIITASLFMLTVAGVMYIVSSGGQLTGMAKGIIEKTLLGFGIFLLSWLLVYTLLNMLSVNEKFIGKGTSSTWFQFECDTKSNFYKLPTGTGGEGTGTGTGF